MRMETDRRGVTPTAVLAFTALWLVAACTGSIPGGPETDGSGAGGTGSGAGAGAGTTSAGGSPSAGGGGESDGGTGGEPDDPIVDPTYPKDGFCAEGGMEWAFCEDFDGQGDSGPEALDLTGTGLGYSLYGHSRISGVTCEVSQDCSPYFQGGTMLTNAEDSGFGWSAIRIKKPIDFASGEGHLRFTTNFNWTGRMNLGVILSPLATNSMPDNRRFTEFDGGPTIGALNASPALAIKAFRTQDGGGRAVASVQVWDGGAETQFHDVASPVVIGFDLAVPHDIDVFVTRTHVRMHIDGQSILDQALQDIGFDRAYVYLAGLSYNAMKEDGVPHTKEANTVMWDNIAFEGPSLETNAITPDGSKDVVFRAHAVSSCTVKGVPAQGPLISFYQNTWVGWTARLPADAGAVTTDDIDCTINDWPHDANEPRWGEIEIVERGVE